MATWDLQNKVIVITGGGSGIGAATALACADVGMDVVVSGRTRAKLDAVVKQVADRGRKALAVECDVNNDDDVQHLVDQSVREMGRIDVMFANAGFGRMEDVLQTTERDMREMWETNYFGTVRCVKAAVEAMLSNAPPVRGHVLICSSAASLMPLPFYSHYSATKAAQASLAGAMRPELAPHGIRVTSVHPVGTRTEFFNTMADRSQRSTSFNTPKGLMQTSDSVARCVVRALRTGKSQVWPMPLARFGLSFFSAFPALGARIAQRLYDQHHP